ncbi:hypothetical protein KUTeg_001751 [Tegillarca granosa]|uniref:C-type lectin domain-containing protein n=1 Tax=Tegillarca granosa TaxID=220873 RepID=A0ABQ9FSC2_TEGGR|nr:hypothetical protein KUTeg_001751 [Tegillarca granosa]
MPSDTVKRTYNGKCLEFVLQEGGRDWDLAEANCVKRGGHLVTIQDIAEQNFILSTLRTLHFSGKGVWIGLTDYGHESRFTWSSGERLTFTHWEVGQPGSGHEYEDCVLLKYPTGYWSDELCREFVFSGEYDEWICEYIANSQRKLINWEYTPDQHNLENM